MAGARATSRLRAGTRAQALARRHSRAGIRARVLEDGEQAAAARLDEGVLDLEGATVPHGPEEDVGVRARRLGALDGRVWRPRVPRTVVLARPLQDVQVTRLCRSGSGAQERTVNATL